MDTIPPARFGRSICLLCGRRLGTRNRSDEDVVPKWVQREFELGNQLLHLPNNTTIRYRQLRIPCCRECNNEHLSRIEQRVEQAVQSGPEAVKALDPLVLFLWLGKIFYGLMYRDFLLLRDRCGPRRGPILPRSVIQQFESHKFFLQAARRQFEFKPELPASIFVFRTQVPENVRARAALNDALEPMTISFRMGSVGILAALQDGGAQRLTHSEHLARYQDIALHPIQFAELTAKFFYKASLLNRVPKFISVLGDSRIVVTQMPIGGLSARPLFNVWDWAVYARVLAKYTDLPIENLYQPLQGVWSWLDDGHGGIPQLDFDSFPFG